MEELMDKKVYILVGSDVASVLQDMGREDIIEDEEKFEKLLDFVDNKMEIPWDEYVETVIDIFLFREEIK